MFCANSIATSCFACANNRIDSTGCSGFLETDVSTFTALPHPQYFELFYNCPLATTPISNQRIGQRIGLATTPTERSATTPTIQSNPTQPGQCLVCKTQGSFFGGFGRSTQTTSDETSRRQSTRSGTNSFHSSSHCHWIGGTTIRSRAHSFVSITNATIPSF